MMYMAYNTKTGEIIECGSRKGLQRIVRITTNLDRKYNCFNASAWIFRKSLRSELGL